jgi:lipopolysaccharide/colanic/teichoic acid biosynthesis glycosyltransferase
MRTDSFDGESLVSMHTGNKKEIQTLAKHTIDFTFSLFLILLLFPVMIAAAVATRFSSPGPVFFVQKRLGFNKRIFRVYKFRTMIDGAERLQDALEDRNEVDGAAFKIRNDPRITRVGLFLRKTSIDELPQLFNVLKGEMSLVGPRPLPIRDYNGFSEDWHRRRFSVRPGITCLWQISGRSNISFDRWMELDIEYIDRWSLSLDFMILAKTIPAVIKGSGAV